MASKAVRKGYLKFALDNLLNLNTASIVEILDTMKADDLTLDDLLDVLTMALVSFTKTQGRELPR